MPDDMTYDEWKEAKGGEPFFKAARNVNRNMDMHKEYTDLYKQHKEAFKQAVPKNFNDFQDLKYKNTDAWKQMVSNARTARLAYKNPQLYSQKIAAKSVDIGGGSGIIKSRITYRTTDSGKVIAKRAIQGNYSVELPNGSSSKVENPVFDKYEVFAGKGSDKELRVRDMLVKNYGGNADNWFHAKGYTMLNDESGNIRKANVHWFEEETVGIRELRVKGWSKK